MTESREVSVRGTDVGPPSPFIARHANKTVTPSVAKRNGLIRQSATKARKSSGGSRPSRRAPRTNATVSGK